MAQDPTTTAAERYFLKKAEEVVERSAQVAADLSALRVRVEEHGKSIRDLRNLREPAWVVALRLLFMVAGAFALGAVWGGSYAP